MTPPLYMVEIAGARPSGRYIRIFFGHIPANCVIGIVGENGAGKSTLLKLINWAEHGDDYMGRGKQTAHRHDCAKELKVVVWRGTPADGFTKVERRQSSTHQVFVATFPPCELVEGKDGWMEAPIKGEALCTGLVSTSGPILESVGVPPTDLYMAAAAASQDGGGAFSSLPKLDARRKIIEAAADLLWLHPLAELGEEATKPLGRVVRLLEGKVDALKAQAASLAEIDKEISEGKAAITVAEDAVTLAAADLDGANQAERTAFNALSQAEATATAAAGQRDRAAKTVEGLVTQAAALKQEGDAEPLAEMRERLAAAKAVRDKQLAMKPAYDAAVARVTDAEAALSDARRAVLALGKAPNRAAIEKEIPGLEEMAATVAARRVVESDALAASNAAQADLSSATTAAAAFNGAGAKLATAAAAKTAAAEKLERLKRTGAFVEQVPCRGGVLFDNITYDNAEVDCSTCPALGDARDALAGVEAAAAALQKAEAVVTEATSFKADADAAEAVVVAARTARDTARTALDTARASLAEAVNAETRLAALRRDLEISDRIKAAEGVVTVAGEKVRAATAARDAIAAQGRDLRTELAGHLKVEAASATKGAVDALEAEVEQRALAAVDGGASTLEKIHGQLADARKNLEVLTAEAVVAVEAAAAKRQEHATAKITQAAALAAHTAASVAANQLRWAATKLEGQRDPLVKALAALPPLAAALADAQQELADYTLMRDGFGSRGAPGLIIDAEGAAMSADLMEIADEGYQDHLWEVEFRAFDPAAPRTQQEQSDFYVREVGTEGWRLITEVSGGQGKMLSQAEMGALRRLTHRRTGRLFPEIQHDERDTGLSPSLQPYYVTMLRATGPGRHIVVSHSRDIVQPACDYRLHLDADGGVRWE